MTVILAEKPIEATKQGTPPQITVTARNRLVEKNQGLVRKIAHDYSHKCCEPFADLLQVGYLGLIRAIDRFDTTKKVALTSFAVPYIRGAILQHLRDRTHLIKVPRLWQENYYAVRKAALTSNGTKTEETTAHDMGIDSQTWLQIKRSMSGYIAPLNEKIRNEVQDPRYVDVEQESLALAMETLEPLRRRCLHLVYVESMSRKQAAIELGLKSAQLDVLLRQAVTFVTRRVNASKMEIDPHFLVVDNVKQFAVLSYKDFLAMQRAITDAEELMDTTSAKFKEAEKVAKVIADAKQQLTELASRFAV